MSKRNLYIMCWRSLVVLSVCAFLSATAHAQVSFVQITDPHIFDDTNQAKDNRLNNRAAFASCLDRINHRVADKSAAYDFVVITGDLGIEHLLEGADENNRDIIGDRIRKGAADLASMLVLSNVGRWLFVPGNNDLVGAEPEKIKYYHLFIEALTNAVKETRSDFEIKDLCPKDDSRTNKPYDSRSDLFKIRNYAFIGFDDTSFKNDADPDHSADTKVSRVDSYFDIQQRHVRQVRDLLADKDITYAYIFYHIPEVEDPHYVTLQPGQEPLKTRDDNKELTGGSYVRSAWFVKREVGDEWNKVVRNPKVIGLFAGHFHDTQGKTYQNVEWLLSSDYLNDSKSKLHICPPLALKSQDVSAERTRGFQEVYLDKEGAVSTRLFWLQQADWKLDTVPATAEAESFRQLELGRAYESLNRLKEAEVAYAKAAENQWQPTRERGLNSLAQVIAKQDSFYEKYLRAPLSAAWVTGMMALGAIAPTVALLALFGTPTYYVMKWRAKRVGRDQLKVGPIVDLPKGELSTSFEQVTAMILGRMRTHYKQRSLIVGQQPKLPMLARSQSADVASLVEAVVPGGLGKFMALLLLRKDRPKYSIEGVIQVDFFTRHVIFISLLDAGESLKSWGGSDDGVDEIISRHKELAYAALRHLVRHMN